MGWWPKPSEAQDRGGFQNRDVGRTQYNREDFGPDYGIDYARFADETDKVRDQHLCQEILDSLTNNFQGLQGLQISARNGFVIVKGRFKDDQLKKAVFETIRAHEGVREIISDVRIEQ